jgi:hypothetical protein
VVTEEQEATLDKKHRHWAVDEWGLRIGPTAVDHQILSASEAILFKDRPLKELVESIRTIGQKPKNPDKVEAWWEQRRAIQLKYLKSDIDDNITLIRKEIRRLDQLWMSEV